MSEIWSRLAQIVRDKGQGALVTVLNVRGSAPREPGARMVVAPDGAFTGTIGGGQLEWEAIQLAVGRLRAGSTVLCVSDFALGPDLGQCCGGRVTIAIEMFCRDDLEAIEAFAGLEASGGFICETVFSGGCPHAARRVLSDPNEIPAVAMRKRDGADNYFECFEDSRQPVLLFGAGHVGRALVLALAPLPFRVTWVDARPDAFPKAMPQNATAIRAGRPARHIDEAPAGSLILIMTHSHPLDLELTRAALSRPDLPYVGVIGSATKRARFLKRLRDSGIGDEALARLRCPIGIDGIDDKAPPVIAASVAAELLLVLQAERGKTADTTGEFPHAALKRKANNFVR